MAVAKENKVVHGSDLTTIGNAINTALSAKVGSTDVTSIVKLTQAEYDALSTKDATTLYVITDSALSSSDVITALGYTPENQANKVTSLSSSGTDTQYPSAKATYDALADKQDALTFDNTPTNGSSNPVTSGGVYSALAGKADSSSIPTNYVTTNTTQTITGVKSVSSQNGLLLDASSGDAFTTGYPRSLVYSPLSWNTWHDHFAFLRSHTLMDVQASSDGTSWSDSSLDLTPLFSEKEVVSVQLLAASDLAFRFTLNSNNLSHSMIEWFVFGVNWTSPWSDIDVTIEYSADNSEWSTWTESSLTSNAVTWFVKAGTSPTSQSYVRFTFTKTTNTDTGILALNSINALTLRKGNQGLGRENSYPFAWNASADVYPIESGTKDLGKSWIFWKGVYANSFVANGGTSSMFLKADGSKDSTSYEPTSNKVTALSSSSTDTQYPSAKCVYDLVGDIETLILAL